MDTLESTSPKDWCDKMRCQRLNCVGKRQVKFIYFCDNLESLDPTKAKGEKAKAKAKVNRKI
eukprot:12016456-Ditylum_brightwellii.AAC.1